MKKEKRFWLGLSFVNLTLVALMGFLLRSKILFPLPFLNYKHLLNAHSHLAFSGWVGLALLSFFVYDVLPEDAGSKKFYQGILWGVELSSVGMAISFPFLGYAGLSIVFSTLYILVCYVFAWRFYRDVGKAKVQKSVRWLSVGAVFYLILSSIGPFSLAYLMAVKSADALLHRDALYTFLHLQYNGFFTLGIFALYFQWLIQKGIVITKAMYWFVRLLITSVIPSLFLSLLWHNLPVLYILAAIGCGLVFLTLIFSSPVFRAAGQGQLFQYAQANIFWVASFMSFLIKMVLMMGTLYRPLGNAVYGARPVIIGFLHLVFLGFVSFFILSRAIEDRLFTMGNKLIAYPVSVFALGILANEILLMLQGLEVLFQTYHPFYHWGLWVAAFVLFAGAAGMAGTLYRIKNATAVEP